MKSWESFFKKIPLLCKENWLLISILLVLFFVSKLSINLPLMALSLFIVYKASLIIISKKIADSRIFVAVIAVFFYILILQSISLVTWLISHSFPLSLNIFISLIAVLGIYFPISKINSPIDRLKARTSDFIASIVVLGVSLVFILLPIHNTQLHNGAGLLVLANYNVDDGSHLGMLNARLQYNVATTSGNDADTSSQGAGGISYPSGWPAANAAIIQAFNPSIKVGSSTLLAYLFIKIFWLLFLVFLFTRSIFALYALFSNNSSLGAPSLIWITISSLLFTSWFLVDPFFYGFFSFIPQLITIPLFILSLIQLALINKKSDRLLQHLMLPVILSIGAALSWFLLFPIFILSLLLCLLRRVTRLSLKIVIQELVAHLPYYIFFYLVIIASLFAQLYMVIHSSESGVSTSFINSLLLNGGINIYPVSFYATILIGIIFFFGFIAFKENARKLEAIFNYILSMTMFAGYVYLVQLYKIHENLYYYFKILNTVTLVGILMAIVGGIFLVNLLQERISRYSAIVLSMTICLIMLQFSYPGAPFVNYAQGARALSASIDQQILSTLKDREATSNYSDGVVTIFYPSNNPVLNEVASTLVQASKPYTKCYATLKAASFSVPVQKFTASPIFEGCTKNNRIIYYVEPPFVQTMRLEVAKNALSSRVTILPIAH